MYYYKRVRFLHEDILGRFFKSKQASLKRLRVVGSCLVNHKRFWRSVKSLKLAEKPKRVTYFGSLLRMKQKFQLFYTGIKDYQFKNLLYLARKLDGELFANFIGLVESRLDVVCYRSRFFSSILEARQQILHGKVWVNQKCIWWPNYCLRAGDVVCTLSTILPLSSVWIFSLLTKAYFKFICVNFLVKVKDFIFVPKIKTKLRFFLFKYFFFKSLNCNFFSKVTVYFVPKFKSFNFEEKKTYINLTFFLFCFFKKRFFQFFGSMTKIKKNKFITKNKLRSRQKQLNFSFFGVLFLKYRFFALRKLIKLLFMLDDVRQKSSISFARFLRRVGQFKKFKLKRIRIKRKKLNKKALVLKPVFYPTTYLEFSFLTNTVYFIKKPNVENLFFPFVYNKKQFLNFYSYKIF
jgi:ribosomal protein S4